MILLVPIHLDALSLKTDQPVLDAAADFTRLPYTDETRDVNGDVANISEELLGEPFQNGKLYLKAGIHLHWALPDALTKAVRTPHGMEFPCVPNRWLITRHHNRTGEENCVRKWIVESDYLYPQGEGENIGSISFPLIPTPASGCPFRFLGRKMPFEAWLPNDSNEAYLENLTAVGYGDPTFAAFYPNCRSVFGFHDPEFTGSLPVHLQYDVIGWYNNTVQDPLQVHLKKLLSRTNGIPTVEELRNSIEKELKWTASPGKDEPFPDRAIFYTSIVFNSGVNSAASSPRNTFVKKPAPAVTVGNTGTEALAAYLASVLANEKYPADDAASSALKSQIENQIEALSYSSLLNDRQLDIGAKFQEARHEQGFSTVASGTIWNITARGADESSAEAMQPEQAAKIIFPKEITDQLDRVNCLQRLYDRALERIESRRRQLFADWYKYMLCVYPPDDQRNSYPDVSEVKDFIESRGIDRLEKKLKFAGGLTMQTDESGKITKISANSARTLAGKLATALNRLSAAVNQFNENKEVNDAKIVYGLQPKAAPRYYQPNDPVVLLTGKAAAASLRHGRDGRLRNDQLLECELLPSPPETTIGELIVENLNVVTDRIEELKKQAGSDSIAFSSWSEQPWNPFLLEWEAEVFPVESQGNLEARTATYQPDFITGNFTLKENAVDLSVIEKKGRITKAANVYSGSSILTSYASLQLIPKIEKFLLENFYQAEQIPAEKKSADYFAANREIILNWYQSKYPAEDCSAPANLYRAYLKLKDENFHGLSQSLGGFNAALLMHKQTMQLDIADPLGFEDYQAFTKKVKNFVRQSNLISPQPLNDFNPIRTGALRLLRLRLVDTFGQTLELDCHNAITTEQLRVAGSPYEMSLPPRLSQPARINFRWLSAAAADRREMNEHPNASPICGWVMPNNLDGSLMIYDWRGAALGSINRQNKWQSAPGSDIAIAAGDIQNPHLRKMVKHLLDSENKFLKEDVARREFLRAFISTLDSALENIEPENFAQHQELALLMGSPLAVVRAAVNLEVQGLPAVHQGWNVFRQDLRRKYRDDDGFDQVEFPIRLGEYRQFNDGLVGYWKETAGGYEDHLFYAPQSSQIENKFIRTPTTISQTVSEPPQILTILMDPRGSVHAASGILPVKAINIPADQFAEALQNIEITFLSTPVLTGFSKLRLPLSGEPGYEWSWLQNEKGAWTEITSPGIVKKRIFVELFAEGAKIWESLRAAGWIKPVEGSESALIAAKNERTKANPEGIAAELIIQIESLLDQAQLGATDPKAVGFEKQKILEGWLKLSRSRT